MSGRQDVGGRAFSGEGFPLKWSYIEGRHKYVLLIVCPRCTAARQYNYSKPYRTNLCMDCKTGMTVDERAAWAAPEILGLAA